MRRFGSALTRLELPRCWNDGSTELLTGSGIFDHRNRNIWPKKEAIVDEDD
jgi:hypothetical protein